MSNRDDLEKKLEDLFSSPGEDEQPQRIDHASQEPSPQTLPVADDLGKVRGRQQASEASDRSIVHELDDGYYEVDQKGNFTFVNEAYCRIVGYSSPDEVIGLNYRQQLEDDETAYEVFQVFNQVYRTGQSQRGFSYHLIRPDGEKRLLEISISLVRDADNEPVGFRGILHDVTDRVQQEKSLRDSEARYRTLFDNIADPIFIFDNGTKHFLDCNRVALEVYGYTLEELRSMTPRDLHPSEEQAKVEQNIDDLEDVAPHYYTHVTKTGKRLQVEIHTDELEYQGRQAWVSIVRDVTERRQADKALRESESRIRSIVDSALDAVISMDGEGLITGWNPQATAIFGWSHEEVMGQSLSDLIIPERHREAHKAGLKRFLVTGEGPVLNSRIEIEALRRDGSEIPVELTISSLHSGDSFTFNAFVRDITVRKQAEVETERLLAEQQRRAVQLHTAAEVSHAASSVLEPEELLKQTVDLVRDRFDLYYVGLFLVEEGDRDIRERRRWAVLRAGTGEAGRAMISREHKLAVDNTSMIGFCINNRRARIAVDVGEEAVRFDNPFLPETRSELALPLISRDKVLGAMSVQSTQEAAFSDADVVILRTMADQVANAIVNVTLLNQTQEVLAETEEQARRLSLLSEMIAELNRAADVQEIYRIVGRRVGAIVPANHTSIAILTEPGDTVEVLVLQSEQSTFSEGAHMSVAGTAIGKAIREKQVVIASDLKASRYNESVQLAKQGLNSMMVAPLIAGRETIGTLILGSPQLNAYSDRDEQIVLQVVSILAASIQNQRLFEQTHAALSDTETQARRLRLINEMDEQLSRARDVDAVLKAVARFTPRIVVSDRVSVALLEDTRSSFELFALQGEDGVILVGTQVRLEGTAVGRCVQEKRVISTTTVRMRDYADLRQLAEQGIVSAMNVPLLVSGQVIGTLNVGSKTLNGYPERDENVLLQVGSILASTIENRRLFEQMQTVLAETRALYDVSQALAKANSTDEILASTLIALNQNGIASGADGITLATIEVDKASMPEWSEDVAAWRLDNDKSNLNTGKRYRLQPMALTQIWMRDPSSPIMIANVETDERLDEETRDVYTQANTLAMVMLPLSVAGRWVGLLNIFWNKPQDFPEHDKRIYRSVMGQVATLVESQRLVDRVRLLAAIVENHPDFIGVGDLAGNTLYINPAGLRMLGLPADHEVTGMDVSHFFTSHDVKLLTQEGIPTALKEGVWSSEANLSRVDNTTIPVHETVGINYDAGNRPASFSITMRDVTERQLAAAALSEALTEAQTLYEVNWSLTRPADDVEQILARLIKALNVNRVAMGAHSASLMTVEVDREGRPEWATFAAWWCLDGGETLMPLGTRYSLDGNALAAMWINDPSSALLFSDIQTDEHIDDETRSQYMDAGNLASVLMPLRVGERWVGALSINWSEAHEFSEQEIRIFQAIMGQLPTILDNRRLFEETRQRLTDLTAIQKTTSDLTASLGFNEAIDVLLPQIVSAVQVDAVSVFMVTGEHMTRVGMYPKPSDGNSALQETFLLSDYPLTKRVVETRRPLSLAADDPRLQEHAQKAFESAGITASATIPLVGREGVLGVLSVSLRQQDRTFTDHEIGLLQTMADQATIAFERVRLFDETRRAARRQLLINKITNKMRAAISVEEVLRIAVDELREATHASRAVANLSTTRSSDTAQNGSNHE